MHLLVSEQYTDSTMQGATIKVIRCAFKSSDCELTKMTEAENMTYGRFHFRAQTLYRRWAPVAHACAHTCVREHEYMFVGFNVI